MNKNAHYRKSDDTFLPGDLVKIYESRYKRSLFSYPGDDYVLGIVLSKINTKHFYKLLLFKKDYVTGSIISVTHYKNLSLYEHVENEEVQSQKT